MPIVGEAGEQPDSFSMVEVITRCSWSASSNSKQKCPYVLMIPLGEKRATEMHARVPRRHLQQYAQ